MKAGKYILWIGVLLSGYTMAQVKKASPQTGVHFLNTDWKHVLIMAKQMHKPIFVDAYASWCVPCQEMRQTTFKDLRVSTRFNARYINVAVDADKGPGKLFADYYQVTNYPTLLFINEDGQLIKRIEGFTDAEQLSAVADNIK